MAKKGQRKTKGMNGKAKGNPIQEYLDQVRMGKILAMKPKSPEKEVRV